MGGSVKRWYLCFDTPSLYFIYETSTDYSIDNHALLLGSCLNTAIVANAAKSAFTGKYVKDDVPVNEKW